MWSRPAAVGLLLAALAGPASAQESTYSGAVPPDQSALDRLNLRTEWSTYLPVDGRRDGIGLVQTIDDQIFVQTRRGWLIAVDARTGRVQWTADLGNGGPNVPYPVAANSQFVFVANVTRLFAFYRTTGVVEFTYDMGSPPATGLAADNTGVYAALEVRARSPGAQRLVAYNLPRPIVLTDPRAEGAGVADRGPRPPNPVDELTRRYPSAGVYRPAERPAEEAVRRAGVRDLPLGGLSGGQSPSLAVTATVTPPYRLESETRTPSLATLPTLRQPYRLRDESGRDIQRTPSLVSLPPSVASALALTDLRSKGVTPATRWEYGLGSRVLFTPVLSPLRLWVATDARTFLALDKDDKSIDVAGPMSELAAAAPGQAGVNAYLPLSDGTLVAVDLAAGNNQSGPVSLWRANVGGYPNRTPVVTKEAVYAAGENSGVTRVDRASGDVVWRTADRAADRVVGVNDSFVYVRDRLGRLQVYDAARANAADRRAVPLTGIDVPAFNVPVVNTVSDRVYLAADNGLMVCLRDASARYAVPVRMAPDISVNTPVRTRLGAPGQPGTPPPADAPPKEPKKGPARGKDDADRKVD